jgi:hypothetical protein
MPSSHYEVFLPICHCEEWNDKAIQPNRQGDIEIKLDCRVSPVGFLAMTIE